MSATPIRGFLPNTLIDWPGRLAAEIFLGGCNLRCPYCHAGYLLADPPGAETFELQHVLTCLKRETGWIDGVVVSGGEPTLHPGLPGLLAAFKAEGLEVKLDTNGTTPDVLEALLAEGLIDSVAMDVKAPLDDRYARATGRPHLDVSPVRRSLAVLRAWGGEYELRTTVCPSVLTPDDVVDVAADVEGAPRLVLQQFQPGHCLDPALNERPPYPEELLLRLAEKCCRFLPTTVRGCRKATTPAP